MNMQITEVKIDPTDDDLVRAYVTIVFDDCLMIGEIKIIKGTKGLLSGCLPKSKKMAPIGILLMQSIVKRET
jgi:DNA-binding cell septation regulator SpoVG